MGLRLWKERRLGLGLKRKKAIMMRWEDNVRDAIIFDQDGTMVDVRGIRHYVLGKNRNYHAFHREAVNCPPNPVVVQAAVDAHEAGQAVLIVTAREIIHAYPTMFWLTENLPVPYDELYMRPAGDYRPDHEIKREILDLILRDGYNPVHAWDDRPEIAEVWESAGIPTTLVTGVGFDG
jgi:hypothetical protein